MCLGVDFGDRHLRDPSGPLEQGSKDNGADRDATHKPARLIEIDDPCYGTSKPEMRCRRVVVSAKRVVPQIPSRSCPGFMFIANIKGNIRGVYHMA